jgi:CSLREA domain-containing protein
MSRRATRRTTAATAAAVLALVIMLASPAEAATINVTPGAVDSVVNGNCSLREAITAANTDAPVDACAAGSGADIINAPGTFILNAVDNDVAGVFAGPNGLPVITSSITIRGATITRAPGAPDFRIFQVAGTGNLTLDSASVSGGTASCSPTSCNGGFALGGGIFTDGTLTLVNSQVRANSATCSLPTTCSARGGGIYQKGGTVTVTNGVVADNRVTCTATGCDTAAGGAVFADSGVFRVSNSDVSANTSSCVFAGCKAFGGGILNNAGATIGGTRLANNVASCSGAGCVAQGGAIFNNVGSLTLTGSLVSANQVTAMGGTAQGGGIFKGSGPVTLSGTNVTNNTPDNCRPPGAVPGCLN